MKEKGQTRKPIDFFPRKGVTCAQQMTSCCAPHLFWPPGPRESQGRLQLRKLRFLSAQAKCKIADRKTASIDIWSITSFFGLQRLCLKQPQYPQRYVYESSKVSPMRTLYKTECKRESTRYFPSLLSRVVNRREVTLVESGIKQIILCRGGAQQLHT